MNHTELELLLDSLIATWENEVVEFKQAGNDYDTDRSGAIFLLCPMKPICVVWSGRGWCSV